MKLKSDILERCTILLIVCQVVVFRYFNVHETMNKVIVGLIGIVIALNFLKTKNIVIRNIGLILSCILYFSMMLLNGFIFGTGRSYMNNFLMLLYPIIFMLYITWYIRKYPKRSYKTLYELRYLINIYYIVNIVVMFIQLRGTYFMVGYTNIVNDMYQDLISGLFGYSMTATVCYFSAFVICYNVVIMRTIENKLRKRLLIVYNIAIALIMAYLSTRNDNVQYFALLPLSLVLLMFSSYRLNTVSGFQKVLMITLVIITLVSLLMILSPQLMSILENSVFYKFSGAIEHMYDGANVSHGSMERLALLIYGLNYADGWKMGLGFAASGLYTPGKFGFVHFGNANIGSFVCLGGIWFFLSVIILYSSSVLSIIRFYSDKLQKVYYYTMIPLVFYCISDFFYSIQ